MMSGWKPVAAILGVCTVMVAAFAFYAFFAREVTHWMEGEHHFFHDYEPWSLIGFIGAFVMATALCLPAQVLHCPHTIARACFFLALVKAIAESNTALLLHRTRAMTMAAVRGGGRISLWLPFFDDLLHICGLYALCVSHVQRRAVLVSPDG